MIWRLLPTLSAPMPFQMALDKLLFAFQKRENQTPVLRFYVSSAPWISVGCSFRDVTAFSKSDLILKNPEVPVCRRMTGGGCVLHGRDLIFSLVARYDVGFFSSVQASYVKIHESVKIGLKRSGFDVKFYGGGEFPKGKDCFEFPVESDLYWEKKKIAGGAQKRSEGVFLHQESISIPQGVEREQLIRSILKGMEQVFGVTIQNAALDSDLYFQAERDKG